MLHELPTANRRVRHVETLSFSSLHDMQVFVCAALVAALCGLAVADEKGDVGTVIGIDLGTTYSWFDDKAGSLCALHFHDVEGVNLASKLCYCILIQLICTRSSC